MNLEYKAHMKFAFKTLHYAQPLDHFHIKWHCKVAVAQEILTSSLYIDNSYGFCACSTIHDFSNSGDLWHNVKQKGLPTMEEKLRIAYWLAAFVADAHHFDECEEEHHGPQWYKAAAMDPDQWRIPAKQL